MNIRFTKPRTCDLSAFLLFYETYAAKLWGIILSADLPAIESKTIMARTLLKAWYHPDRRTVSEGEVLTWLVHLAHTEGLSLTALSYVFSKSLTRSGNSL